MGMGALGLANLLATDGQLSATPHGANLSPLTPRKRTFRQGEACHPCS